MYFLVESVLQGLPGDFHIIMALQVEPELRLHTEKAPKSECSISSNGTSAVNDFIDPTRGNANIFSKPILTDPYWC